MAINTKAVLFLLLSVFALWVVYGKEGGPMDIGFGRGKRWQDIAATKRRENMSKIPQEWLLTEKVLTEGKQRKKIAGDFIENLLDSATTKITSMDNDELLSLLADGSLSALQVTSAFCKRAAYAHQLVRNPRI